MKKKNFLNGVGAKLALAVVALTSTVLTSCEEENFNVQFEANPAKVYIIPTVIDAATNAEVANATITGNTEITGSKDIAAQTVEITAEANGVTGKATVNVKALAAGGVATYTPTIILSAEFETKVLSENPKDNTVWGSENGHDASYDHNGKTWFENATEYLKTYKVKYDVVSGSEYSDIKEKTPSYALDLYLNTLRDSEIKKETKEAEFKVSAWSIFYTTVTYTTTEKEIAIVAKASGETVATAKETEKSCTKFEQGEAAHPSHAGHYQHGHGAHGDGSNAGGGIVIAD